jgi:hypothetical protein
MAKRFSLIERQQHLDAWQRSGLTKQVYCRQHSITISAFYYWIKHNKGGAITTVSPAFIPTRLVLAENNSADVVILNLPNGCSVSCLPIQLRSVMQTLSLC